MSSKPKQTSPLTPDAETLTSVPSKPPAKAKAAEAPAGPVKVLPDGMGGAFRDPYPPAGEAQEEILAEVRRLVEKVKDRDGNPADPLVEVKGWNLPKGDGPRRQGPGLCYVNVIAAETAQPAIQAILNGAKGPRRAGGTKPPVWDTCQLVDTDKPVDGRRGDLYGVKSRVGVPDQPAPADDQ